MSSYEGAKRRLVTCPQAFEEPLIVVHRRNGTAIAASGAGGRWLRPQNGASQVDLMRPTLESAPAQRRYTPRPAAA
jgi:predicted ATPase